MDSTDKREAAPAKRADAEIRTAEEYLESSRQSRAKRTLHRQAGNPPLRDIDWAAIAFAKEAKPLPDLADQYGLAGMRLSLSPSPRDRVRAINYVMDALRRFHFGRADWYFSRPYDLDPIELQCWTGLKCSIACRGSPAEHVIRAEYLGTRRHHLTIELPNPRIWPVSGLGWLGKNFRCAYNREGAAPWYGPMCLCDVEPGAR